MTIAVCSDFRCSLQKNFAKILKNWFTRLFIENTSQIVHAKRRNFFYLCHTILYYICKANDIRLNRAKKKKKKETIISKTLDKLMTLEVHCNFSFTITFDFLTYWYSIFFTYFFSKNKFKFLLFFSLEMYYYYYDRVFPLYNVCRRRPIGISLCCSGPGNMWTKSRGLLNKPNIKN